jgi:hypothetical protein
LWRAWSNIRVIENTDSIKEDLFWKQWRDILLTEYNIRLSVLEAKGLGTITGKKTFTAIFLQLKGFSVPVHEILPEVIKVVRVNASFPELKEYDDIAMLGHSIGMVENSSGIKQYLQDIGPSLRPDGGLIFTLIDISRNPGSPNRSAQVYHNIQIQQASLIGPFFAMLRIKADVLKNQTAAANWRCEFINRQDETNYAAQLIPFQS